MVLFSGDGDFRSLVEALQRRGRKVSVVSTVATQPPMIADDLRRQADHFIELASLRRKSAAIRTNARRGRNAKRPMTADDDYRGRTSSRLPAPIA